LTAILDPIDLDVGLAVRSCHKNVLIKKKKTKKKTKRKKKLMKKNKKNLN